MTLWHWRCNIIIATVWCLWCRKKNKKKKLKFLLRWLEFDELIECCQMLTDFFWKGQYCRVRLTIDDPRVGGGGAGTLRCGGSGGAILFVLTFGLRSFAIDKLFALPVPVVAGA